MKIRILNTLCSVVVLCLALYFTPVMATSNGQIPPVFEDTSAIPTNQENIVLPMDTFSCANVTDLMKEECEVLVALYNSTNGTGWSNNANWLVTNTVGNWFGVSVSASHVTQINLPFNLLTGSIPPQLGSLSNLQFLYLYHNQLSGTIPPELGNLSTLIELNLSYNQLSGNIPGALGSLGNLVRLDLNDNQLTGSIPPELGSLSKLEIIYLNKNQLSSSIPGALGNLTSLQYLFLNDNQLTGSIPPELGNLSNLGHMTLENNQLSGSIPGTLGSLTNLRSLYLKNNQLNDNLPPELGNLSVLVTLDIQNNQLSGNIPAGIGNANSLRELFLNNNQLSGSIPAELSNIDYLNKLHLQDNQLTGSIPPEFGIMTSMDDLRLANNQLSGIIPTGLGNMTVLRILDLSNNLISGNVPAEITNLVNLCPPNNTGYPCYGFEGLDLGYNHLTVPATEPPATFLANLDPDWYLTQALGESIIGETGGNLISNDGNVEVLIPAGAVSGEVTFYFDPQPAPSQEIGELSFAENSFLLTAQDTLGNLVTEFSIPITLNITYDEASLGEIIEQTLRLFYGIMMN